MTTPTTGFSIVDKPAGMTSHDVVARMRRLARTRKVGHGGTLDPMATGVLVIAVGRVTRLLNYVSGCDKSYDATIRLGQSTVTDDAEGEVTASFAVTDVAEDSVRRALTELTGTISQVPSAVSAVKINGERAYKRVRAGEDVTIPPRTVTISRIDVTRVARGEHLDVDVEVDCSSGTYIRAIARDLGAALGVGGHLTRLRRTAVGGFTIAEARTLDELGDADTPITHSTVDIVERLMPVRHADTDETKTLAHGGFLSCEGTAGPYAVVGPDGTVIAVVREERGKARPEIVLAAA